MGAVSKGGFLSKVAVSTAAYLPECKNTEFVGELSKGGFCEGCRKWSCPLTGM